MSSDLDDDLHIPNNAERRAADSDSSEEDLLSEVDEALFANFDPRTAASLANRAQDDEPTATAVGVHKRKRAAPAPADSPSASDDEDEYEEPEKAARRTGKSSAAGAKREKQPRQRRRAAERDDEEVAARPAGERRRRAPKAPQERKAAKSKAVDDENLTPEEKRRRELDRVMDDALRNPNLRRKKKDGIDIEHMMDHEIEEMRNRMRNAAQRDNEARSQGLPAMNKLAMLPDVLALLNRNTIRQQLVDPDSNLLESVGFFLEPLSDGSLPAYNIQRELFASLARLPVGKETLVASGIGKVALFYTRSKKAEDTIRRAAERLVSDWMRPILKRSDDYRKREIVSADYDPSRVALDKARQAGPSKTDKALALPVLSDRARVIGGLDVYTVAPKSNMTGAPVARQPGQGGEAAFKKLKARHTAKAGGGRR